MRRQRSKPHRLMAWWDDKEKEMMFELSPRFCDADMHWLYNQLFSGATVQELQDRGYDMSTLVFHIDKTPAAVLEHEKRAGRA